MKTSILLLCAFIVSVSAGCLWKKDNKSSTESKSDPLAQQSKQPSKDSSNVVRESTSESEPSASIEQQNEPLLKESSNVAGENKTKKTEELKTPSSFEEQPSKQNLQENEEEKKEEPFRKIKHGELCLKPKNDLLSDLLGEIKSPLPKACTLEEFQKDLEKQSTKLIKVIGKAQDSDANVVQFEKEIKELENEYKRMEKEFERFEHRLSDNECKRFKGTDIYFTIANVLLDIAKEKKMETMNLQEMCEEEIKRYTAGLHVAMDLNDKAHEESFDASIKQWKWFLRLLKALQSNWKDMQKRGD